MNKRSSFVLGMVIMVIAAAALVASQSRVMAWGRKSGDRIIAEVMVCLGLGMTQEP